MSVTVAYQNESSLLFLSVKESGAGMQTGTIFGDLEHRCFQFEANR